MSSCDTLSQASCSRCRNSAMVLAGSGERVSSEFIMSQTCSIGERSGVLSGQGSCCTTKSTLCRSSRMWKCVVLLKSIFSCWKAHFPIEEMAVARVKQLVQCRGQCYFTLQKHQMWPRVVTDGPPHHETWGGACVSCANALLKMTLSRSTPHTCTSISRIQPETTLITEDSRAPFQSLVHGRHARWHKWKPVT